MAVLASAAPGGRPNQTRRAGPARPPRAALHILIALALALAAAFAGICGVCPAARATVPGVDSTTLTWDTANRVYYGNYNTPIFTTVAADGTTTFAYCVDPTTAPPDAGGYVTLPVEDITFGDPANVRAAMWFGYGGPGFDPAMWPDTWSDGLPMNDVAYYAATHLILTYATTTNSFYSYYNAGSKFISYAASTFMGMDLWETVVNPNSTLYQMFARADEVPDDFVCYYLDCGRWDYTQYIIAQDYYGPLEAPTVAEPLVAVKEDRETGGSAQGQATLAGALFEVAFYDGLFTLNNLPDQPTYRWTVATDEQGRAFLADGYLVDGDEPPRNAQGAVALPAGTLVVREVAAPDGYELGDAGALLLTIEPGADGALVLDGVSAVSNDVVRGGVSVQKSDAETFDPAPQGAATLAGAQFSVTSLNERPVLVGGAAFAEGETVAVLLTDELGFAQTAPDALPFGTYRVQETQAPDGYLPNATAWDVAIRSAGIVAVGDAAPQTGIVPQAADDEKNTVDEVTLQVVDAAGDPVVAEQVIRGGIRVYKVDADTQAGAAQGDASLEGTEFSIVSLNSGPVLVDGVVYQRGETVMTIYTDATGMAQTGARDLPYGIYTVDETGAPPGYLRAAQTVSIEQDGVIVEVGEPFADAVKRGGVAVNKVDADSGLSEPQGAASLAGAAFAIANASAAPVVVDGTVYQPGETVATMTTDESGHAQTAADKLPFGTYTVTEVQAPEGYLASTESRTVEVREEGVIVTVDEPFAEQVARGGFGLRKFDAETGEAHGQGAASLAGAAFEIVNANDHPVIVDGQSYAPGAVVATIKTNEDGWTQTADGELPFGTYTVREAQAPEGYHVGLTDETGAPTGERCTLTAVVDGAWSWHSYESELYDQVVRGGLSVAKVDADRAEGVPQGDATLAGATFAIVNASARPVVVQGVIYEPGKTVATLVTDENGFASTGARDLPYGVYTVSETSAPAGYLANGSVQTVMVCDEGAIVPAPQPFAEQVVRGGASVQKIDLEIGVAGPQGSASYEGAVFTLTNASANPVVVDGQTFQPGEVVARLVTDADGFAATAADALPYGRYSVRETQAPQGYLASTATWDIVIDQDGVTVKVGEPLATPEPAVPQQETIPGPIDALLALFAPATAAAQEAGGDTETGGADSPTVPEQVVRGGVRVQKVDAQTGLSEPQGSATLEGAVFEVVNRNDNPVLVDGTVHAPGSTVLSLATNAEGVAESASDDLPFGQYEVFEASPPQGYLPGDPNAALPFSIDEDGVVATLEAPFANEPIRGGVAIQKVDADSGRAAPRAAGTLLGARFAVVNAGAHPVVVGDVSYAPGETVATLVTDADGRAQTGASDLPFGTYAVVEVAAPEGYVLDAAGAQTVEVDADGVTASCDRPFANRIVRGDVAGVKVEDETGSPMPGVAFLVTSLTTGERHVVVADDNGVFSTASAAAPHTCSTNANDAALDGDGAVVNESLLSSAHGVWFTGSLDDPARPDDTLGALPFDTYRFDELATSASYGHTLVSFEVSVRADGTTVDLGEVNNHMIELKTEARMAATGTHEGPAGQQVTVVDTVSYRGLEPGAVYELHGELMDRATGAPLLDAAGVPVTAQGAFVPGLPDGSVEVTFTFDASLLAGTRAVAFERLVRDGIELASHTDLADDLQTVSFVAIATSAVGAASGTHEEQASDDVIVVDTVSYRGLTPGATYRLDARLVDRATGETLVDAWGEHAVGGVDFSPTTPEGSIEVEIAFDATELAGTSTVVFESLLHAGVEVASHADLTDAGQTVSFISLGTSARDAQTGTNRGAPRPDASIIDTVSYRGLEPGATYEVEGFLIDLETLAPLEDEMGTAIRAAVPLTPAEPDGSVEVEFLFDASGLQGHTVVVFENLLRAGAVIASHADLDDAEQTVSWPTPLIPKLGQTDRTAMACAAALGGIAATTAGAVALLVVRKRRRARRDAATALA